METTTHSHHTEITKRITSFKHEVASLFQKKRGKTNLLPHQRRALSWLRKQKKFQQDDISEFSFASQEASKIQLMEGEELKVKIKHAIDSLPPKCRAVFMLSRYEELTYKEIAAKLDISVKTVENQMGKALRVMREHLKDHLHCIGLIFFYIF